ncbi:hypothetical protein CDAR_234161 [Caerostris darwini]|uniref:Uncharacterized protein n=1 Tax=Caerostris darwini TaxID=1538125 RepID=A0AAV4QLU2_9ARAC|nr:hypothetical protein CDAR_234161 [Caerostris darwini]
MREDMAIVNVSNHCCHPNFPNSKVILPHYRPLIFSSFKDRKTPYEPPPHNREALWESRLMSCKLPGCRRQTKFLTSPLFPLLHSSCVPSRPPLFFIQPPPTRICELKVLMYT